MCTLCIDLIDKLFWYTCMPTWFVFLDEDQALDLLPKKMRSDIAMNVHFSTLSKVKIFKV